MGFEVRYTVKDMGELHVGGGVGVGWLDQCG